MGSATADLIKVVFRVKQHLAESEALLPKVLVVPVRELVQALGEILRRLEVEPLVVDHLGTRLLPLLHDALLRPRDPRRRRPRPVFSHDRTRLPPGHLARIPLRDQLARREAEREVARARGPGPGRSGRSGAGKVRVQLRVEQVGRERLAHRACAQGVAVDDGHGGRVGVAHVEDKGGRFACCESGRVSERAWRGYLASVGVGLEGENATHAERTPDDPK